jgi:hypothetical protein
MEAAATLAENIDNVLIPAVDTYRLGVLAAAAPASGTYTEANHTITAAADITSSNAYAAFLGAQEILDGLNLDPSMEVTLKGSAIEDSFHEFLDAIKTLLSAYVQSLHALDKEIQEAADNYQSAQQKIGSDVSNDAGEIRSQAGSIDVA